MPKRQAGAAPVTPVTIAPWDETLTGLDEHRLDRGN
jgi:hypothetical protein